MRRKISSGELLQRARCFALRPDDMGAVLAAHRSAAEGAGAYHALAPEVNEAEDVVALPHASLTLFECSLFRGVAAYGGWRCDADADGAPVAGADGAVALRSSGDGASMVGFDAVEKAHPRPLTFDGTTALDAAHLEFFSRTAKVEAALSDWGVVARAVADTGNGPSGMDDQEIRARLLTSAVQILKRHGTYWILTCADPTGRAVAVQSDGWLFLFTGPDLALRHAQTAKAQNPDVPDMAPHSFSSKQVRDHARQPQLSGVWINPPAAPPPNAALAGTKLANAQLGEWYGLVDEHGHALEDGW